MTREQLIERLAGELTPVRARTRGRDTAVIGLVCAVELTLFLLLGHMGAMRDGMAGMAPMPLRAMPVERMSFWWKLVSLGAIAVASGTAALASFRPAGTPRRALPLLAALIACVFAAGWAIDAAAGGGSHLLARLDWHSGVQCTWKMVALSVPPMLGMATLMRRGAATDMAASATVAGLSAACWGAFVFVFACPVNDPFYIAVWYTVGCGIVTLFSRVFLPRIAHW